MGAYGDAGEQPAATVGALDHRTRTAPGHAGAGVRLMFSRLAAFAERRAVWIVAGWLAAAAVLAVTAPSLQQVGTQDETAFLPASSPSQRADRILRRLFPNDPTLDAGIVVFSRDTKLTDRDRAYIGEVAGWLRRSTMAAQVGTVQSAASDPALAPMLRAPDGGAELLVVGFRAPPFATATIDVVERIRDHLDATAPAGLGHHLTGTAGLAADQASGIVRSFERTAVITVLLVLVILVFVYRSALAPLIPLATIGVAFVVSRGVIALMAERGFEVASLAETFIVVMIFGAGTDYCLFIVSRYREDLGHGEPLPDALRGTMTVVGAVIAASAMTVIVGFLSQLTARFGMYRTMGPAMGVAIFVTLVAGLTLTPALLRLAGRRAFWPGALRDERAAARSARWERVATAVQRRPAEVLLAGVILLLVPAAGLGWFRESFDLVRELPPSADAREGFDALAGHYSAGALAPVYLVIAADGPITDAARLAALDHLTDVLRAQPGVGEARSLTQPAGAPLDAKNLARLGGAAELTTAGLDPNKVDVGPLVSALSSPGGLRFTGPILSRYPQLLDGPLSFFVGEDGRSTRVMVALDGNPYDRGALPVIRGLDDVADEALAGSALSGARLAVGGPASFFVDMQDIGGADFRVITAVLIGGIFCVLALLLRSAVAPFYLLASVVLSFAATLGLCALVFIAGLGDPGISFWLPPFLFVILVALGADYNIFIMSRIREEADAGAEVHHAVARGLVATGHVITSAGLILAGTFAVLVAAPLPQLRQIGFAATVGVLVDTFVVRSLIVPAATMLLGRWAFWPALPGMRPSQSLRARPVVAATAAIVALGVALVALATAADDDRSLTRISGRGVAAPADSSAAVARPAGSPPPAPPLPTPPLVAPFALALPPPPTASRARPPTTAAATPPPAAPSSSAAAAGQPMGLVAGRVAVPSSGAWRYRLEGTRTVGVPGLAQPFAEDATTKVTRVGGDDESPEVRLQTDSSSGSQDDRRRYRPGAVELLAARATSAGMSFGGTLQPPQVLIRWPLRVGDRWAADWTAEDVSGHTTTQVVATREVSAAGRTWQCWVLQTDINFTGTVQGEQHQRACWVPTLGMSIDDDQQLRGTYNGVPFDVRTHATLIAAP